MGGDIAYAARRRQLCVIPPGEGHGRWTGVVIAVDDRPDLAQHASGHDLPGPADDRDIPCPERHVVGQPGVAVGGPHLASLPHVHPNRLLAEHMLAPRRAGHDDLMMERVGRGDQHKVNVRVIDDLPPVVCDKVRAVLARRCLERISASRAQRHDPGVVLRFADLAPVGCGDVAGRAYYPDPEPLHVSLRSSASHGMGLTSKVARPGGKAAG